MMKKVVLVLGLAWPCACDPSGDLGGVQQAAIGGSADPDPTVTFNPVGLGAGIDRSREPASAGPFNGSNTEAYGVWLADLDGDGRLDYYAVNHGQTPHTSGLFLNTGGGFGPNLFTVGLQSSAVNPPNLGNSNEMRFVGDLTGDGLVDFYHRSASRCSSARPTGAMRCRPRPGWSPSPSRSRGSRTSTATAASTSAPISPATATTRTGTSRTGPARPARPRSRPGREPRCRSGALVATATTAPFSYTLDLTPGAGSHALVARAFDAAGNTTDSAPITIQPQAQP